MSELTPNDIKLLEANKIPLRDVFDGTLVSEVYVLNLGDSDISVETIYGKLTLVVY